MGLRAEVPARSSRLVAQPRDDKGGAPGKWREIVL